MTDYKEKFEKMRVAGKLASRTLDMLTDYIKPGISTDKIDKLGYGFIKDNDSEKDIFLHVTSLEKSKLRVLKENQEIEFEIKEEKGKLQAVNLKRL